MSSTSRSILYACGHAVPDGKKEILLAIYSKVVPGALESLPHGEPLSFPNLISPDCANPNASWSRFRNVLVAQEEQTRIESSPGHAVEFITVLWEFHAYTRAKDRSCSDQQLEEISILLGEVAGRYLRISTVMDAWLELKVQLGQPFVNTLWRCMSADLVHILEVGSGTSQQGLYICECIVFYVYMLIHWIVDHHPTTEDNATWVELVKRIIDSAWDIVRTTRSHELNPDIAKRAADKPNLLESLSVLEKATHVLETLFAVENATAGADHPEVQSQILTGIRKPIANLVRIVERW